MVRIAPVRLSFNPKTLWFDANGLDLHVGDPVVVLTARGDEFGHVSDRLFDMAEEDAKKLNSPLKPVRRAATEEDIEQDEEMARLSAEALPAFKRMASESVPEMSPIAVEYLFEGDKAVFYFDAEERVDFRDLVRRLASYLRVRVDMKQVGVRDGARMVGGLGHCGQELCCRRLGGDFNPVSIRMAKEQDLSLNPQKISGVCGRLMCCLRYEFDAYKDFHARAPKKNARVTTPDGEGKVVDLDVVREVLSIKVGDEKPVKVPLADMEPAEEGARPSEVGEEAWERATSPAPVAFDSALSLFSTSRLSGEDKLAEPGKIRRKEKDEPASKRSRSRRRGSGSGQDSIGAAKAAGGQPRQRKLRRRSTTVRSDGSTQTEAQAAKTPKQAKPAAKQAAKQADGQERQERRGADSQTGQRPRQHARRRPRQQGDNQQPRQRNGQQQSSRRSDKRPAKQQDAQQNRQQDAQQDRQAQAPAAQQARPTSKVGRNSSALRANRAQGQDAAEGKPASSTSSSQGRRRRRSHRGPSSAEGASE